MSAPPHTLSARTRPQEGSARTRAETRKQSREQERLGEAAWHPTLCDKQQLEGAPQGDELWLLSCGGGGAAGVEEAQRAVPLAGDDAWTSLKGSARRAARQRGGPSSLAL